MMYVMHDTGLQDEPPKNVKLIRGKTFTNQSKGGGCGQGTCDIIIIHSFGPTSALFARSLHPDVQ